MTHEIRNYANKKHLVLTKNSFVKSNLSITKRTKCLLNFISATTKSKSEEPHYNFLSSFMHQKITSLVSMSKTHNTEMIKSIRQ